MGAEAVLEELGWAEAAKGRDPLEVRKGGMDQVQCVYVCVS